MNAGEYGITYNLDVNYNISGYSSLSLAFTRPDGTVVTVTNPAVTVGTIDLATPDDGTFPANQYCKYTFANGDINQAGTYTARLTYQDSTKHLISDPVTFTINP